MTNKTEYKIDADHQKQLIDKLTAASLAFKKQHCALMVATSSDLVIINCLDMTKEVKDDLHIAVELDQEGTIQGLEEALQEVGEL